MLGWRDELRAGLRKRGMSDASIEDLLNRRGCRQQERDRIAQEIRNLEGLTGMGVLKAELLARMVEGGSFADPEVIHADSL